jgi:hypothetical protein
MDDHSVMLEHTLVLAGEVVDSGMVWQVGGRKVLCFDEFDKFFL